MEKANEILAKLREVTRNALDKIEKNREDLRKQEEEERISQIKNRAKEIFDKYFSEKQLMYFAMKAKCSYPVLYMKNVRTWPKNSKRWIKLHNDIKNGKHGELTKYLYLEIFNHGFEPEIIYFYSSYEYNLNDSLERNGHIHLYDDNDFSTHFKGCYLGIQW